MPEQEQQQEQQEIQWHKVEAVNLIDFLEDRELLTGDIVEVKFPDGVAIMFETQIATSAKTVLDEEGRMVKTRKSKSFVRANYHGTPAKIYLRRKALSVRRVDDFPMNNTEAEEITIEEV